MQLSSSVFKNTKVIEEKVIVTDKEVEFNNSVERLQEELKKNGNTEYDAIDRIGAFILDNAKTSAEKIYNKAIQDAEQIEKEAYERGLAKGHEDGFQKAYEETVVKGTNEAENLKALTEQNVSNIMRNAKISYNKYLEEKEIEIKKLALSIAKQILKREIKCDDGINQMVTDALSNCKNNELIIIKCSKLHFESLEKEIEIWKKQNPMNGELVIIKDDFMSDERAVIERDNGKITVDISIGIDKIKEHLLSS